jgi:large subunit ribosomal protein L53
MLTKYITAVTATFSPFNAQSGKTVRSFLAMLPANARTTMALDVKMLGRADAAKPAKLVIKFSTYMKHLELF